LTAKSLWNAVAGYNTLSAQHCSYNEFMKNS